MGLPQSTPQNGLSGFYLSPISGAYFTTISGKWIGEEVKRRDLHNPDLIPRCESDQYLSGVCKDDVDSPVTNKRLPGPEDRKNLIFNVKRSQDIRNTPDT